eukprot:7406_1
MMLSHTFASHDAFLFLYGLFDTDQAVDVKIEPKMESTTDNAPQKTTETQTIAPRPHRAQRQTKGCFLCGKNHKWKFCPLVSIELGQNQQTTRPPKGRPTRLPWRPQST